MNRKQTTNSLTVEVTAYLSINLNGTWELIGFEPNTMFERTLTEPSPKQTTLDDGMSPIDRMYESVTATQEALDRAKKNPRHYSNRPTKHNWNGTIRKIQECTVCQKRGVNKRTCLAHLNGGDRVHRRPSGLVVSRVF